MIRGGLRSSPQGGIRGGLPSVRACAAAASGDGYYHVNWGWNGQSDGFFLLSVLNPYNTGGSGAGRSDYGYAYDQYAILGVMPSTEYSGADLSSMEYYMFDYSGTTINMRMRNRTGITKTFEMGFGYMDAAGELHPVYTQNMGEVTTGTLSATLSKDIAGLLPDGTYTLYAINRVEGASQWNVFTRPSFTKRVTVEGGETTIIPYSEYSDINLEVTDWQMKGTLRQGSAHELTITVRNNGEDYNREIVLFGSYDGGTTVSKLTKTMTAIAKGEKNFTIAATSSGAETGDKTKLQATSIIIDGLTVEGGQNTLYCKYYPNSNADAIATGHMTIKNTADEPYSGQVQIYAYVPYHDEWENEDTHEVEVNEMSYPLGQFSTPVSLAAGESTTVDFKVGVSLNPRQWWHAVDESTIPETLKHDIGLLVDMGYDPVLEKEYYTMNGSIEVYPYNGVEITHADGTSTIASYKQPIVVPATATSVDLRGFSGNGIVLNTAAAQPNCLYLRYGTESDITGLPAVNVIKGTTAEEIALTDGYDFVPPFNFTAENISSTRTPSIVTNGTGGWQTLVLPFAVTRLVRTDNNAQLNWFQSDTDDSGLL